MSFRFEHFEIQLVDDLELDQKTVFLRVDFNVPVEKDVVVDDTRIREAMPTLKYLLDQGAKVLLASHFGRPKAKVDTRYSLAPVAQRLAELINQEVVFADDCIGDGLKKLLRDPKHKLIMLENLRFHSGEETNDPLFVDALSQGVDVYVNDAFGALHRDHASITGLAKKIPVKAVGFLVQKELEALMPLVQNPPSPYAVILGGAKVSDKLKVIEQLLKKVDRLFVGGAMAFTFLKANGIPIGKSLYEEEMIGYAKKIMTEAENRKISVFFPRDFHIAKDLDATETMVTETIRIPEGWMGLDVGPKTVAYFSEYLKDAKTVFWNGPMGVFEKPPFNESTFALAKALAKTSAKKIIGGGDSVSAVIQSGVADQMDHISTGGGATLKFLQDPMLVGLKAIARRTK